MSRKLIVVAALIAAIVVGIVIGRSLPQGEMSMDMAGEAEREVLYWVAPMDPDFRRDEPGLSPMGMDLKPVYANEMDAVPGTVKIDPTIVNNLGVRTMVAEESPLSRRIETVGYVGYDEDTLMHVHLRVDGWIEGLSVTTTGDAVKKGQVLFELYSPTLVNAQEIWPVSERSDNAFASMRCKMASSRTWAHVRACL